MRNRSSGGGSSTRNKRIIGVVLLAGLCISMTLWAMRARDGGRANSTASGVNTPTVANDTGMMAASGAGGGAGGGFEPHTSGSPADTTPATTTMLNPDPRGRSATVGGDKRLAVVAKEDPQPKPDAGLPTRPLNALPALEVREPITSKSGDIPLSDARPAGQAEGGGSSAAAIATAERAVQQQKLVEARNILNRALFDPSSTPADRANIRKRMGELNQNILFGPAQIPGDPLSETYKVIAGDKLNKINRKLGLITEPSLIARVNKMSNPNALQVGQTLKVIRGPFHAVVSKSAYRMDVYAGPTPGPSSVGTSVLADGAEPGWTYICSFPVGLGAQGLTPIANFTIKEGSKLIDPHWTNPRTGEKFDGKDPKNPIGERWMGLEGLDAKSKSFTGYGVHGTIDPASVGQEMSMGCVRMASGDIEIVYELLTGRVSVVKIVP